MSEAVKNVEPYEAVRELYAENISKNPLAVKLYMTKYADILRKHRITILDKNELCRVGFYLDDLEDRQKIPADFDIGEWVLEQIQRNPSFFTKYFRQSNQMTLKKPEETEKPEQTEPRILPDLSASQTAEQESASKNQAQEFIAAFDTVPSAAVEQTDSINDNYSEVGVEAEAQDLNYDYLSQMNSMDVVADIQKSKRQELMLQLQKIVEAAMGINFYDKDSLIAQLAEVTIYRKIITGIFAELGVESSITSFSAGITERKLAFNPERNYTLDEIKRGLGQAAVKISALKKLEITNKDLEARIKSQEAAISRLSLENKANIQKAEDAAKASKQEQQKPKEIVGDLLYVCVGWVEKNEDGKNQMYYLAVSDKQQTDDGYYLTKYMIKTTKRADALRFATRERAKLQLGRVIKNYKKNINRKSGISLDAHLKNAKLVAMTAIHEPKAWEPPAQDQS